MYQRFDEVIPLNSPVQTMALSAFFIIVYGLVRCPPELVRRTLEKGISIELDISQ